MKSNRPTSVLTLAILHLVFGGLGLICTMCAGLGSMGNPFGGLGQQQGQQKMQAEMEKQMDEKLPAANAVQYGGMAIDAVLSFMLIAGGIGLLKMASWARTLSLVYAALSLLHKLFGAIYSIAFMIPLMTEIKPLLIEEMRTDPQVTPQMAESLATLVGMTGYFSLAVVVVTMLYPTIVLIIMLRPSVAAAFRGEVGQQSVEDYHDDRNSGMPPT